MGPGRHRRRTRIACALLLAAPLGVGLLAAPASAAPDQPPVFGSTSNNTAQTIDSGTGLARLTASDPDNDPLTYSTAGTLPPGISLAADGTFAGVATNTTDRILVYAPVSITVDDAHGGTASTSLTVTVEPAADDPPVAAPDTADTTPGTAVTIAVLANDSDPNGDALTLTSFTQGSRGSGVTCTAAGTCVFTPAPAVAAGTEAFTYVVNDGRGASTTGTVTVTLDNVKPAFTRRPGQHPRRRCPSAPRWPPLWPATPTATRSPTP